MMGNEKPAGGNGGPGRIATDRNISRYLHDTTFFRNVHGQVVGRLIDGWLTKRVHRRKHQLRHPPAWCVDSDHLNKLEAVGAQGVLLVDDTGTEWRASVDAFRKHGILIDRGHGTQVALPLRYWGTVAAGQISLFDLAGGAP